MSAAHPASRSGSRFRPAILLTGLAALLAISLSACFEGPAGPQGEKGEKGDRGQDGSDGRPGANGTSVKTPLLSGFYRIHLQGTDPKDSHLFVDSSQFMFFGESWSYRLYRGGPDSCSLAAQGKVDYGGTSFSSIYQFTDSAGHTDTYEVFNLSTPVAKRVSDPDLLGCAKCEFRRSAPCKS